MSRDKQTNTPTARECEQIEDMACDIHEVLENENIPFWETHLLATILFDKGYRKASEGEWVKPTMYSEHICSNCGKSPKMFFGLLSPYCPNCGAKMKGE